jgi:hypothetical protein
MTILSHPFFFIKSFISDIKIIFLESVELYVKWSVHDFTPFWTGSWVSPVYDSDSNPGFLAVADHGLSIKVVDLRTTNFAPDDRLKRTLGRNLSHCTYCSV